MKQNQLLTKRESEVGELKAWGYIDKEIAERLFISTHTVTQTMKNVYRKTGVTSVGQWCAWWFCKNYDIAPKVFISAILMFFLTTVNELHNDDFARPVRTAKSRKGNRRNDDEGAIIWI